MGGLGTGPILGGAAAALTYLVGEAVGAGLG